MEYYVCFLRYPTKWNDLLGAYDGKRGDELPRKLHFVNIDLI